MRVKVASLARLDAEDTASASTAMVPSRERLSRLKVPTS